MYHPLLLAQRAHNRATYLARSASIRVRFWWGFGTSGVYYYGDCEEGVGELELVCAFDLIPRARGDGWRGLEGCG